MLSCAVSDAEKVEKGKRRGAVNEEKAPRLEELAESLERVTAGESAWPVDAGSSPVHAGQPHLEPATIARHLRLGRLFHLADLHYIEASSRRHLQACICHVPVKHWYAHTSLDLASGTPPHGVLCRASGRSAITRSGCDTSYECSAAAHRNIHTSHPIGTSSRTPVPCLAGPTLLDGEIH